MPLNRRKFLHISGATAALGALPARAAAPDVKAVLFDAFPIFDARPVIDLAEEIFPGKGKAMATLWRDRQFEYQWLRVLSHNYADFWQVTGDSLGFACAAMNLALTDDIRTRLMNAYLTLKAWTDVPNTIQALKARHLRLAFLSNMTRTMLDANISSARLDGVFDEVISSDNIHS